MSFFNQLNNHDLIPHKAVTQIVEVAQWVYNSNNSGLVDILNIIELFNRSS